jgi:hypothetical protein
MTTYPATAQTPVRETGGLLGGIVDRLRAVEAWLDRKGRGAWIAATVLGFIFAWPVGLFLVFYITATNRWSKNMFGTCTSRRQARAWAMPSAGRPSGNSAFDAYRAETLRRLEEEQEAFEAFLQRLREAKDKSEFDAFMEDRAKGVKPSPDAPAPGAY